MKHPFIKITLSCLMMLLMLHQPADFNASETSDVSYKVASFDQLVEDVDYSGQVLNVKVTHDFDLHLIDQHKAIIGVELINSLSTMPHQWVKLQLALSSDLKKVIASLVQLDGVIYIEPEYLREPELLVPNETTDPDIISQWYLDFTHTLAAWQYAYDHHLPIGGSPDVIVAVIDTGIDILHPDLIDNIWVNPNEVMDQTDSDGNGYIDDVFGVNLIGTSRDGIITHDDVMDTHINGHGSHVSGIIGAVALNDTGIAGLAFRVKIMPIKATDTNTFTSTNIALGIQYAIDHGAHVINMSLGGSNMSQLEADFVYEASKYALLVAAAGNSSKANQGSGALPFYPASLPFVLGVMSASETPNAQGDFLSGFSNYDRIFNSQVEYELMAPGYQIYSTTNKQNYGMLSGTSMASPMVAAVAAMLFSMYKDVQPQEVFHHLVQTADLIQGKTLHDGTVLYYRSLNAYQAISTPLLPYVSLESFDVATSGVSLNDIDDTKLIELVFDPSFASNQNVSFVSANHAIASVDQFGVIQARDYGQTSITITSSEKPSLNKSLSVLVGVNRVDSVNLLPTNITLKQPGERIQLKWDIKPYNAANTLVSFTSSEPTIVSVNASGMITAMNEGNAIITIKSDVDQKTATSLVTVAYQPVLIQHQVTMQTEGVGGIISGYVDGKKIALDAKVDDNKSVVFKAQAQSGYRVYRWLVNGTQVQIRHDQYELNIKQDSHVVVEFVKVGDVNLDGQVTISDLILLRRFLAQLDQVHTKGTHAADVNFDQAVTISDLILLRRQLAGLE